MVANFADLIFKEGSPNLLWGLLIGIPLLLFAYLPFILTIIGFTVFLTKKDKEVTTLLLSAAAYFWILLILQRYIFHDNFLYSSPVEISHAISTAIFILICGVIYFWAQRNKKHMKAAKIAGLIAVVLSCLYFVEIIGLLGATLLR